MAAAMSGLSSTMRSFTPAIYGRYQEVASSASRAQDFRDAREKDVVLHRFANEIRGPDFEGFHLDFFSRKSRNEDRRDLESVLANCKQQAMAVDEREVDVEQHEID